MRKLSGIFAALLLLLSACAPAAAPTEATTPETQGEELVSTLSMLPKQAISIHRAETPAKEDTETDQDRYRVRAVLCVCRAADEQLVGGPDACHKVDRPEPDKDGCRRGQMGGKRAPCGRPLGHVAGGAADGLLLSAQPRGRRRAAPDGRGLQRAAETFGNADFFAEQKLLLIDICRLGSDTLLDPVVLRAEDGTVDIVLRMSAPTVGEVRGNGMVCLIPVPSGCTGAEITLYPEGK